MEDHKLDLLQACKIAGVELKEHTIIVESPQDDYDAKTNVDEVSRSAADAMIRVLQAVADKYDWTVDDVYFASKDLLTRHYEANPAHKATQNKDNANARNIDPNQPTGDDPANPSVTGGQSL